MFSLFRLITTKSAVKVHTFLDLRGAILAFIYVTDGKTHHDTKVFDLPAFEPVASHLSTDCDHQKGASNLRLALHMSKEFVGLNIRENQALMRLSAALVRNHNHQRR